jgi:hypothetical protein
MEQRCRADSASGCQGTELGVMEGGKNLRSIFGFDRSQDLAADQRE